MKITSKSTTKGFITFHKAFYIFILLIITVDFISFTGSPVATTTSGSSVPKVGVDAM